jgi:carbon starvation protein CstA
MNLVKLKKDVHNVNLNKWVQLNVLLLIVMNLTQQEPKVMKNYYITLNVLPVIMVMSPKKYLHGNLELNTPINLNSGKLKKQLSVKDVNMLSKTMIEIFPSV